MWKSMIRAVALAGGVALLSACTNYYQVTDPTTGKTYYTTQPEQKSSGATELKDARTGSTITIQNSVVSQISKDTFTAATHAEVAPAPVTPATPAPAPVIPAQ
jgi:uncharacterized protein YdeI (BOF family)